MADNNAPLLFGDEHVRRYVETNGEVGYDWNGVHTLILTTSGRRSGQQRSTPLIFGEDNGRYIVVASKGGAPEHPAWYTNLVAQPEVEVQVRADKFKAHARTATQEEKPAIWKLMAAIWPPYDEYQKKTTREIPLVILERL